MTESARPPHESSALFGNNADTHRATSSSPILPPHHDGSKRVGGRALFVPD